MKVTNNQKHHYKSLGYNVDSFETFFVKNEDLPKNSHILEKRKCDNCGKEYIKPHRAHVSTFNSFGEDICGECYKTPKYKKQVQEKMKNTNLKRYGVEFFQYTEEHREKYKETNIKKLGVEFPAQSQLIKNKMKETWEEKYGKAPSQCEEIKEKVKKTNLEKYGVECSLQNKAVREKAINSIKEKYGVSNVSLSKEVQEKRKNTFIEKYGCENPGQIPEVKNKIANSFYLKGSEFKTSSQQLKIFNILKEEYEDD